MMESIDAIGTKKIIENEIEVLQSRTLINDVIRKLHLYASVWQEGKVRTQSAYTLSPLVVEAKSPDSLKSFDKILMEFDKTQEKVKLNNSFSGPINEWLKTPYGELKFVKNLPDEPQYEEDNEMLIRLIKVRRFLWT